MILWLALVAFPSKAELINPGPVVEYISSIDDQPLKNVKGIVQSQSGFMWLASSEGLLRFDGQTIKPFVHDPQNPNSLGHNDIRGMVEDQQGFLWLITRGGGLSRFEPKTEQFRNFHHDPENMNSLDSDQLNTIALGADGQLWIGSDHGINRFDRHRLTNTRLNSRLTTPESGKSENIQHIYQDSQQRLWFSIRRQGLYLHIPQSNRTLHFSAQADDPNSIDANSVSHIAETRDGQIWIGTALSIHRFEPTQLNFKRFDIPLKSRNKVNHASVTTMVEDRHGQLWVGTFYNGVSLLKADSDSLININSGGYSKNSINTLQVNDIIEDNTGVIWFATPRRGLIKLAPNGSQFEHQLLFTQGKITALTHGKQGELWLAAVGDLYRYELEQAGFVKVLENIGTVKSMRYHHQWGMVINIVDQGLMRLDMTTLALQRLAIGVEDHQLEQLTVDAQGRLWGVVAGDEPQLLSIDVNQGGFTAHLEGKVVNALLTTEDGLWVATQADGLWRYRLEQEQWQRVDESLTGVKQLFEDKQRRLWAATDVGLGLWEQYRGKWQFFTTKHGLVDNGVNSIAQFERDILWLGTESGVTRFAISEHELTHFAANEGLRLQQMSPALVATLGNSDLLMVGTINEPGSEIQGLVKFSTLQLKGNNGVAEAQQGVLLTDFKLFNRSVALRSLDPQSPLEQNINQTQQLTLSFEQNWFSIAFVSDSYENNESIRYEYKLEGLSEQWIKTEQNIGIANFTSVSPGDYLFKVRVADHAGAGKDKIRQLKIRITPPWWASTSAYVVYVSSTILLVVLFYLLRTRQLRSRAAQLEQGIVERTIELKQRADTIASLLREKEDLLKDKDRLITNISHEFRTPLTLILGPLEAQIKQCEDITTAEQLSLAQANANRLLHMVDQLLDLARLKNAPNSGLGRKNAIHTVKFLVESFRPIAVKREIDLRFEANEGESLWVEMQADSLEKIISNLLSNAFKYSADHSSIRVRLNATNNQQVIIKVKDTGQGISEGDLSLIFERFARLKNDQSYAPGAGIGLALVQELVEQHQGTIRVTSELKQGSEFEVVLNLCSPPVLEGEQHDTVAVNKALILETVEQVDQAQRGIATIEANKENHDDSKLTLLVVEDNLDMREYIISCLCAIYHCLQACDGEQGFELAKEYVPDLIVSDVMMPKMDGFDLTAKLKTDQVTSHIPVILLTARGDRDSRLKGWQQKADEFLEKPFNTTELLTRVANLLDIRQILRQRYQQDFVAIDKVEQQAEPLTPAHQSFVAQTNQILEKFYAEDHFDVGVFATEMALSHRQLGRKMKSILNMTPAEALRNFRLKKAAELLEQGASPSMVYHQVGFATHSYFSQCFKARYQCLPSNYCQNSPHDC